MQVDIAVPGTFHAFKLGRQLEQHNSLRSIYTTYPKFATSTNGIPDRKITHIRYPELIAQIGHQFPFLNNVIPSRWNVPLTRWKGLAFDKSVAHKLEPAVEEGIFLGFAGTCLESLRRANELGLTTIVERSSSHIRTQKEILDEEYQELDLGESPISRQHIQREEEEYRVADYVSIPSEFAYQSFIDQGFDEDKLLKIPFGYDVKECVRHNNNNNSDKIVFLYAGAIDIQKGVHYLLKSFNSLRLQDVNLKLAGNISKNMKQFVSEFKTDSRIEFLGWVNNMDQLYSNSSVFVFPSLQEGSAMVTYEAMANGLPVITTFNSGWVGVDGKHGIEVPIRDENSLSEALQSMYNNPKKRDKMGNKAQNYVKSTYTEKDYGKRVFSKYQSIVG